MRIRSKYQPRFSTDSAFFMARSETAPNASPGGSARHFCEEVRTMSSPHASISIFTPPRDETASTKINVSGDTVETASAISLTGFCRPVEVSLWTTVRASNLPCLRVSAIRSGEAGVSQSNESFSVSFPFDTSVVGLELSCTLLSAHRDRASAHLSFAFFSHLKLLNFVSAQKQQCAVY